MKRRLSIGAEIALARERRKIKRRLALAGVKVPRRIRFNLAALQRLEAEKLGGVS